ncbi:B3 domain-containing protein [Rhynchospora pubera]|uniref:B3 domain-containing protein n=1 Tax=Rhynchospora pubera TaxID=906938 RepID=A0AAV8DNA7_9POAL|nr:B3 domain-containing protein [Rhynchospora pubera]
MHYLNIRTVIQQSMAKKRTVSYEEARERNIEENKKKIEALNLQHLSSAIQKPQAPKTPPLIKHRRPKVDVTVTPTRRSPRLSSLPEASHQRKIQFEQVSHNVMDIPRRTIQVSSDRSYLINRRSISYEARECALRKAEEIESRLDPIFPCFVRSMLHSHVTKGFWFGIPKQFCTSYLPKFDCTVILVDENGDEFDMKYFADRTAFSGGWQGFAVAHKLIDGDACVFQLIKPTTMKVYIIRAIDNGSN